jgi:restriction system protein
MRVDDTVVMPLRHREAVALGRVTGSYEYRRDSPPFAHHSRRLAWLARDLPRASLDDDISYSLAATMTVCRISRHDAERRILAAAAHG